MILLRGVLVEDGEGGVGRAVVHADALPVREGLRTNGIEAFAEVFLHVVDGHDDGNLGSHLSY